jgi:hypothetical protein
MEQCRQLYQEAQRDLEGKCRLIDWFGDNKNGPVGILLAADPNVRFTSLVLDDNEVGIFHLKKFFF